MSLLAKLFKNLIALVVGAACAALFIISVESLIEWHRGGHLPPEKKAEQVRKSQNASGRIKKLKNEIALEESLIAGFGESGGRIDKAKQLWHIAVKNGKEFQLLKAEREKLEINIELAASLPDCFARNFKHFPRYMIELFIMLIFFPVIISLVLYYGFARVVEGFRPIIADDKKDSSRGIAVSDSDVSIDLEICGKEHLFLRGGWCKKKSNVNAKTKLMWKWRAPLVTFAADLFELVDFSAAGSAPGKLTVTAPDPDMFISRIDLGPGRAIIIRPCHLVGVTDGIKIKTHWNFSFHNILAGKIRQIILYGNGYILVSGSWGISSATVNQDNSKIESNLLVGYDAHASYSLCRTETWGHYFRKEASLFDIKIENGTFVTQNNSWSYTNKNASFIEKAITAFLNGIGSILGF